MPNNKTIKPTDDQQRAIDARGATLVYAAAGSGKTAVLTDRVCDILLDETNGTDADRLLVVTFTNAAAEEMRSRIAAKLDEKADTCDPTRLWRQQMLLSGAAIGTIDSFCIDLLREHFEEVGIRPDFRVTDGKSTADDVMAVLQELLDKYGKDEGFRKAMEAIGISSDLKNLREAVMKLYESVRALPDPDGWLRSAPDAYDENHRTAWLEKALAIVERKADTMLARIATVKKAVTTDKLRTAYDPLLTELGNTATRLWDAAKAKNWDAAYDALHGYQTIKNSSEEPVIYNIIKEVKKEPEERLPSILYADQKTVLRHLAEAEAPVRSFCEFVISFGERYRSRLIKNGLITFDMAEHMAYDLIADGKGDLTDVGKAIAAKYDYVMVDEYQDTNALQNALFFALSENGKKLFMVGDAKQSIYGFRHAYPGQFIRYRDEYREADPHTAPTGETKEKVVLGDNFRSSDRICAFTNFLFERIMRKETSDMDYDKNDFMKCGTDEQKNGDKVEIVLTESETAKSSETAAAYIASYIRKEVEAGRRSYGDFAVLMRAAKTKGLIYMNTLRRHGIPVSFAADIFYDSAEVLTVIHLLKAVDNPTADVSLIAALTGPLFGLTAEELAAIRLGHEGKTFYARAIGAAGTDRKVQAALDRLSELRREAFTKTVSGFTRDLIEREALYEIAGSGAEGDRRVGNLFALLGLMDRFDTEQGGSLSEFLRYFDTLSAGGSNPDSEKAGGTDAVRIMTVHASKGLEFPVCFVAECGADFNVRDARNKLRFSTDVGLSMPLENIGNHTKVNLVSGTVIADAIERKLKAEEQRLLYVAATRAREKLIFLIDGKTYKDEKIADLSNRISTEEVGDGKLLPETILSANRYADWILWAALLHTDGAELTGHLADLGESGTFKVDRVTVDTTAAITGPQADTEADADLKTALKTRFDFTYPHPEAASLSKTTVTQMMAGEEDDRYGFSRRPALISLGELTPAERGTAMHTFMEFVDYKAASENLEAEIERLTEWGYLSAKQAAVLNRKALASFFGSDLCRRAMQADFCKREQNFLVPLAESPETLVQGCVDLLFYENDGLVLVDFKTTKDKTAQELAETYHTQLRVYADAMGSVWELPVKEAWLWSFDLDRAVSVALSE